MNIIKAIQQHAINQPAAMALRDASRSLSYQQLQHRIDAMASWLTANHINTLAFSLDNGIDWAVCDLAAMQAGICIVPVPTFFTSSQKKQTLSDAGVDCYISNCADNDSTLPTIVLPTEFMHLYATALNHVCPVGPGTACKISYTSGSTGTARGVCLRQETIDKVASSIVDTLAAINIKRHLCILPLPTLLENIAGLYAPLIRGIEVVLPDSSVTGLTGSSQLDFQQFAKALDFYQPDSLIVVPQLLTALLTLTQMDIVSPDYLKFVAVGGGRVSGQLMELAEQLGLPVFEGYGLTECASVLTLNTPQSQKRGSVGKALPHVRLRVNKNQEIEAYGATLEGYLGEARMTNDWVSTGDIGHIDEQGFVYIDGREKNVFITAFGKNISPEWIEAELSQQAAIAQAFVYGEARDHNLALIWRRFNNTDAEISALVASTNLRLPDYARVHAFLIMAAPLPNSLVTDNGRLKRNLVERKYLSLIEEHYNNSKTPIQAQPFTFHQH